MTIKSIVKFFDRLEDKIRQILSRHPIVYSFIGGVAIVLFWRGVWQIADLIELSSVASIVVSVITLLLSGLFVSFFVGDRVILSGLTKEKKLVEKTEEEVETEMSTLTQVKSELKKIERTLEEIKDEHRKDHKND